MEGDVVCLGELEGFLGARSLPCLWEPAGSGLQLRPVPVKAVGSRDQRVVVFEELPIGDENLTQVDETSHIRPKLSGLF